MEYNSLIKTSEIISFAGKCMGHDLQIRLREIS
jgi:hypothetical protein